MPNSQPGPVGSFAEIALGPRYHDGAMIAGCEFGLKLEHHGLNFCVFLHTVFA